MSQKRDLMGKKKFLLRLFSEYSFFFSEVVFSADSAKDGSAVVVEVEKWRHGQSNTVTVDDGAIVVDDVLAAVVVDDVLAVVVGSGSVLGQIVTTSGWPVEKRAKKANIKLQRTMYQQTTECISRREFEIQNKWAEDEVLKRGKESN